LTCEQLSDDAAKAPNIDFLGILTTKDDLRGSVASRLNIKLRLIVEKYTRTNIDYFDQAVCIGLNENVFGLKIAMNYVEFM
jgi:hypothetical protein